MICGSCGGENQSGARFCSQCATAMPERAPAAHARAGVARSWQEAGRASFLFKNEWWTRSGNGMPLVWDPASESWRVPPASQTPFFMRRPRFTPLTAPAVFLYVILGLYIAAALLAIGGDAYEAVVAGRIANAAFIHSELLADAEAADGIYGAGKALQFMMMLLAVPFFIWWTRRATGNLESFGRRDIRYGTGWAVGGWFVPVWNWFRPYQVIAQAWRASDPSLTPDESSDWSPSGTSPHLIIWWLGWTIGSLVSGVAASVAGNTLSKPLPDWGAVQGAFIFLLVTDFVMAFVALLAILTVATLTQRQAARDHSFDLPGGRIERQLREDSATTQADIGVIARRERESTEPTIAEEGPQPARRPQIPPRKPPSKPYRPW